jgi:hypothetical protein
VSYERCPCFACDRGVILVCKRPMDRPEKRGCPKCSGTGYVWAFLYPLRKGRAG